VLADARCCSRTRRWSSSVADDRYIAADAVELVEVEYEQLDAINDPFKAMAEGAVCLREDIRDRTDGAHGKRKHYNHIFTWEIGDREATDRPSPGR